MIFQLRKKSDPEYDREIVIYNLFDLQKLQDEYVHPLIVNFHAKVITIED